MAAPCTKTKHQGMTSSALSCLNDYGSSSENEDEVDVEHDSIEKENKFEETPMLQESESFETKVDDSSGIALEEVVIPAKAVCSTSDSSIASNIISDIIVDILGENQTLPKSDSFQMRQINENCTRRNSICSSSSDSSSTCSSSSDDSTSEDESSNEESISITQTCKKKNTSKKDGNNKQECNIKVKGELSHSELPSIEDLHISVPEFECVPLGKISSFVDDLVVVKALPNTPALDLDSVLFLDKGKRPLGKVFDVIGPVTSPFYCVRFNSSQHIKDNNVKVNLEVYCAPRTEHTSFVFVEQLRKLKGSDASWKDDIEPNNENVEYSDDEEERAARRARKKLFQKHDDTSNSTGLDVSTHTPIDDRIESRQDTERKILKARRAYRPPNPSQQSSNAFYRNSKRYNPRNDGPTRWNSVPNRNPCVSANRQTLNHGNRNNSYRQAGISNSKPDPFYPANVANFHFSSPHQQIPMTDFSIPPPNLQPYTGDRSAGCGVLSPMEVSQISREPISYNSEGIYSRHPSCPQTQENSATRQLNWKTNSNTSKTSTLAHTITLPSVASQRQFSQNNLSKGRPSPSHQRELFQQQLSSPPIPQRIREGNAIADPYIFDHITNEENLLPPGT